MRVNKTIVAAIFSMIVAVAMAAIPTKALAHDWDHGRHNGWGNHNGWRHGRGGGDHDGWRGGYGGGPGWQNNQWGRGDNDGDEGYGNGYGSGYGGYNRPYAYGSYNRPLIPGTIDGMVNPRNPRLRWMCDGGGHHCHWAPNPGASMYNYGAYNSYSGNGYNNSYNPNYGQSPAMNAIGALAGPMLGIPIP